MDLGIRGRTAAVAAASMGLGFGSAAALVAEGVRVAICSRDRARVEAAAKRLGPDAVAIVADVATEAGAASFVDQATREAGLDRHPGAQRRRPAAGDRGRPPRSRPTATRST